MESEKISQKDIDLWHTLYKVDMALYKARGDFLNFSTNRNLVIHNGLNNPGYRGTALRLLLYLGVEEIIPFFDLLVNLASVGHSDIGLVREVILSLPKDFLLANIEKSAEAVLRDAMKHEDSYEEYRRLLELYIEIDPDLTKRLAERALESDDEDIREAGSDAMECLN